MWAQVRYIRDDVKKLTPITFFDDWENVEKELRNKHIREISNVFWSPKASDNPNLIKQRKGNVIKVDEIVKSDQENIPSFYHAALLNYAESQQDLQALLSQKTSRRVLTRKTASSAETSKKTKSASRLLKTQVENARKLDMNILPTSADASAPTQESNVSANPSVNKAYKSNGSTLSKDESSSTTHDLSTKSTEKIHDQDTNRDDSQSLSNRSKRKKSSHRYTEHSSDSDEDFNSSTDEAEAVPYVEHKELKSQRDRYKKEVCELQKKISSLENKLFDMKESEIALLKKENAKLRELNLIWQEQHQSLNFQNRSHNQPSEKGDAEKCSEPKKLKWDGIVSCSTTKDSAITNTIALDGKGSMEVEEDDSDENILQNGKSTYANCDLVITPEEISSPIRSKKEVSPSDKNFTPPSISKIQKPKGRKFNKSSKLGGVTLKAEDYQISCPDGVNVITYEQFMANASSVPEGEAGDSQFLKNLMECVWSREEMSKRSSAGLPSTTNRTDPPKPAVSPHKVEYITELHKLRIRSSDIQPTQEQYVVRTSEMEIKKIIRSKLKTVARNLKTKLAPKDSYP